MFSFARLSISALLLASSGVDAALRSRSLSLPIIGIDFEPQTLVTDHANIDRDAEAIATLTKKYTDETFSQAQRIYEEGAFSKSIANINLDPVASTFIKEDTAVTGKSVNGDTIVGLVVGDVASGDNRMTIKYKTEQSGGTTCNVGGHPNPNLGGCFRDSGILSVDGSSEKLTYSYNPSTGNTNGRTLQGFSTGAQSKMRASSADEFYPDFQKFVDYYGEIFYADKFVTAAFDGKQTGMSGGNADFRSYTLEQRAEVVNKAIAYMNVAMYVIRELEDAISDCKKGCDTEECNDDAVHALDEAVAFYTGSLEDEGNGQLLYKLADKRCVNMGTCGRAGRYAEGTAKINFDIFEEFEKMQKALIAKNCNHASNVKERIVQLMFVPMIQGAIRYAFKTSTSDGTPKSEAEGVAFAASVLPLVHACNADDASTIYSNLKSGSGNNVNFAAVKNAFEKNYECLGITCADVGGLWDSGNQRYEEGASPCGGAPGVEASAMSASGGGGGNPNTGLIIGLAVGIPVGLVLGIMGFICFSKGRAKQTRERTEPTVAEVNDKEPETGGNFM